MANYRNRNIPWKEIEEKYLIGIQPQDLAQEYNVSCSTIRSHACKQKWSVNKQQISNQVLQSVTQNLEARVTNLANKALTTCETVLDDPGAKYQDKLTASKIIIDCSGLKKDKKELSGNVGVQKVFVTPEMQEATLEHIKQVINDQ